MDYLGQQVSNYVDILKYVVSNFAKPSLKKCIKIKRGVSLWHHSDSWEEPTTLVFQWHQHAEYQPSKLERKLTSSDDSLLLVSWNRKDCKFITFSFWDRWST